MTIKVIGVGNPFRRDDGAGVDALRRLEARPEIDKIETIAEPTQLISAWENADTVVLLDASGPAGSPGRISRVVIEADALPPDSPVASTHAFGLAKTIELADALGKRPRHVVIFAIEGEDFSNGEGLSPGVERAMTDYVARISRELDLLTKRKARHA